MKRIVSYLLFLGLFLFSFIAVNAQSVTKTKVGDLTVHVYRSSPQNFGVTSVLLEGKKDVVLVDAQFSNFDAQKVIDMIKATKKNLSCIYISHSDPDFYFGLKLIADNFPKAKIISTPQTAYLINATKEGKAVVWASKLKEYAPKGFVVPKGITQKSFDLENYKIEIKQDASDPDHSYLWIPSAKIILGGISVFDGIHIWLADSQEKGAISTWVKKLSEMESLKPEYVIPAHFAFTKGDIKGHAAITFTKKYLTDFMNADKNSKNSAQLISIMKKKYPNLKGVSNLEMSAKVLKGEQPWTYISSYPAIGKKVEVKFGDVVFELTFKDNETMSFVGKSGAFSGSKDTVKYTAIEIRPKVYMVYWTEPHLKSNVVHLQDFEKGIVYTNISAANGTFSNMKGSIKIL